MKQSWSENLLLRLRPQRNNYTILLDSGLLTVSRLGNCLHKDIQGLTKQHQYHLTSWQKMTNQFTIQASLLSCTFGAKPPSSPTLQALSERAPASKLHAIEIQKQYIGTSIIRFISYMQFLSCIPWNILAVLLLDNALQSMIYLCSNDHRLLESWCTNWQDHKLLASQSVSSVASTVDDIERWNWHNELVGRLARNLCLKGT